jgi:hypothetical protein
MSSSSIFFLLILVFLIVFFGAIYLVLGPLESLLMSTEGFSKIAFNYL